MVTIYLYEPIERGASAAVIEQLRKAGNDDVSVRINSPGGDVAEGIAIYNALKPYKPTVYIDGVAASIASFIAMAGSRIIAAENALVMIHNPWAQGTGDAAQLRQLAAALDKHRDALVSGYARTGLAKNSLMELLDAETWMTAEDALDLGFVDEIAEPLRFAAHAPECFAGYFNTPKELLMRNNAARKPARSADPQNPADPNPPSPGTELETADDKKALEAFKTGLGSDAVAEAALKAVTQSLRERNDQIAAMARPLMGTAGVQELVFNALADPSETSEGFGAKMLALLGRGREPLGGIFSVDTNRASGGMPAGQDFIQAASDALVMQSGIRIAKPHAGARDLTGMGLHGIIRACAQRSGRYNGSNMGEAIRAALTTSDFPAILENALGKTLRTGYESEQQTFTAWTRLVQVPDFKMQSRVILGSAPDLKQVLEGAEYEYGSMDEDKASYQVSKYGRMIRFTWEAMVNDELGAFLRTTQALGLAAARAEADNIYSMFALNSGAGPAMQDSVNLFHADHGNLATSSTALDADALAKARVLLRRQTALGGGVLNLPPRFLLVAPEHEQAAETLLAAAARSLSQGSDNALVPPWLAKLELVVEARLSSSAAYLLTSPDAIDTLERAWLETDGGPVIKEEESFSIDAKSYKVRHVFAARWLDWRGAVKLPISGS